jgi:hypothetical protein
MSIRPVFQMLLAATAGLALTGCQSSKSASNTDAAPALPDATADASLPSQIPADATPVTRPAKADAAPVTPPAKADAASVTPPAKVDAASVTPPAKADAASVTPPAKVDAASVTPPATPDAAPDTPPAKADAPSVTPPATPDAAPDTRPARADAAPDTRAVFPPDAGATKSDVVTPPLSGSDGGVEPTPPPTPPPASINCTPGSARTFDVGAGQAYAKIGDVPWYDLGPGDTVRIFWRSDPYREKILISNRGTADQPIRLCGVAGPNGELPVLSGQNATTGPNMHFIAFPAIEDEGLILINRDSSDSYYSRPGYIVIEGLALRSAYLGSNYTASDGSTRGFMTSSSSVAIVAADNVTVRNCELSDSGMGLFTLSKSETEATLVRDILVEGCHIFGNGAVGEWLEHNIYMQALGMTVQYNRFGRLRDGSLGANLKDRSAGTVIRYNYIEGTVRLLDLVDAQEDAADAQADPRYRQTFVYGNVLISGPNDAAALVHYGGDTTGFEQNFRKGTLYFYNNTVIESANSGDIWDTILVNADTNDEHVDLRNNVIWSSGTTNFHLLGLAGQAAVGPNWISSGYIPALDGSTATVTVGTGVITGRDPMLDPITFHPLAGSPVIDKAVALADPAAAKYPCSDEYLPPSSGVARATQGAAPDFGAFEAGP